MEPGRKPLDVDMGEQPRPETGCEAGSASAGRSLQHAANIRSIDLWGDADRGGSSGNVLCGLRRTALWADSSDRDRVVRPNAAQWPGGSVGGIGREVQLAWYLRMRDQDGASYLWRTTPRNLLVEGT